MDLYQLNELSQQSERYFPKVIASFPKIVGCWSPGSEGPGLEKVFIPKIKTRHAISSVPIPASKTDSEGWGWSQTYHCRTFLFGLFERKLKRLAGADFSPMSLGEEAGF